jgi:hypothetical protein
MSSFAPKDFGTPKWAGGPATITNPVFKYRTFTPKVGRNADQEVKNVALFLEYMDPEGTSHKSQYDVGNALYCQIKTSPDKNSDAAGDEGGPSIANPDPNRPDFTIYPDSDLGQFIKSLVNGGFPESKLIDGDIRVLDGVEVEIYEHPRKEGDKFPLRLVKPGSVKLAGGSTRARKATATVSSDAAKEAATSVVVSGMADNGGALTKANAVRRAMVDLKGKDEKGAAIALLSDAGFQNGSEDWVFDTDTQTFTAV